ncbi:MAG: NUDIX hydrolase [Alphaproteobacteria bacterium]|nr:NUDIX hydrolase [Alphaproteobacteria bacterium]
MGKSEQRPLEQSFAAAIPLNGDASAVVVPSGTKLKVSAFLEDLNGGVYLVVRQHKDGKVSIELAGGAFEEERDRNLLQAVRREIDEEACNTPFHVTTIFSNIIAEYQDRFSKDGIEIPRMTVVFRSVCWGSPPQNAIPDQHLGVIRVPVTTFSGQETFRAYGDIKRDSIDKAEQLVQNQGRKIVGDIDFRVPENLYMAYVDSRIKENRQMHPFERMQRFYASRFQALLYNDVSPERM